MYVINLVKILKFEHCSSNMVTSSYLLMLWVYLFFYVMDIFRRNRWAERSNWEWSTLRNKRAQEDNPCVQKKNQGEKTVKSLSVQHILLHHIQRGLEQGNRHILLVYIFCICSTSSSLSLLKTHYSTLRKILDFCGYMHTKRTLLACMNCYSTYTRKRKTSRK